MKLETDSKHEATVITKNDSDPIVLYLVVRESINMSMGKCAAQVGHAVAKVINWYHTVSINHPAGQELFEQWEANGSRKIVLKASDKEFERLKNIDNRFLIRDAGLTQLSPGTETCTAFLPMRKSEVPKLIKRLQVL